MRCPWISTKILGMGGHVRGVADPFSGYIDAFELGAIEHNDRPSSAVIVPNARWSPPHCEDACGAGVECDLG